MFKQPIFIKFPIIIGIAGNKYVGKSTISQIIQEKLAEKGFKVEVHAFAGAIKDMVNVIIPESNYRTKEETIPLVGRSLRYLWTTLGTDWGRNTVNRHLWVYVLAHRINKSPTRPDFIIIEDLRFREEFAWIKQRGGFTIHVKRPGKTLSFIRRLFAPESEKILFRNECDEEIVNDGDKRVLSNKVLDLISRMSDYYLEIINGRKT